MLSEENDRFTSLRQSKTPNPLPSFTFKVKNNRGCTYRNTSISVFDITKDAYIRADVRENRENSSISSAYNFKVRAATLNEVEVDDARRCIVCMETNIDQVRHTYGVCCRTATFGNCPQKVKHVLKYLKVNFEPYAYGDC